MKKLFLFVMACAAAQAQTLSLQIGNAVAGQTPMMKMAQFVFRMNGCAEPMKASVTASAEGIANGSRQSIPLRVILAPATGVYAISQQWGAGKWMVAITTVCAGETAAAIVPITGSTFAREGIQMLSHAPTAAEIDASLKAFTLPAQ